VYRAVKPIAAEDAKMPIRSCDPRVVRWRLIASLARLMAVEKPMQYSCLDVVVHRLGNGDQLDALVGQDLAEAQRVVAADRDQVVKAELLDVLEDDRREVVDAFLDLELLEPIRPDVGGVLPAFICGRWFGGVQPGAAGSIDRAGVGPVERDDVVRVESGPGFIWSGFQPRRMP